MLDITAFNRSLKTTWIKKYIDPTNIGKWKSLQFLSEQTWKTTSFPGKSRQERYNQNKLK